MIDYISWQTEVTRFKKRLLFFPDRVLRESHAWDSLIFGASYFGLLHRQRISENLQTYPFLCTEMTWVVLNRSNQFLRVLNWLWRCIESTLVCLESNCIESTFSLCRNDKTPQRLFSRLEVYQVLPMESLTDDKKLPWYVGELIVSETTRRRRNDRLPLIWYLCCTISLSLGGGRHAGCKLDS